jgi:hypothetical protein
LELLAIIRRIDTDGDACVIYSEFAEYIRPLVSVARSVSFVPPSRLASPTRMGNTSPLKSSAPARSYSAERSRIAYSSPSRSRVSPSRKPVLRLHDEDQLVHALKDQCSFEQELENAKINLAHKSDFNLYDAFNIFDINRNGLITTAELVTGLN